MVAGESLEAVNITGKRKKLKHYTALETATFIWYCIWRVLFDSIILVGFVVLIYDESIENADFREVRFCKPALY